MQKMFFAVMFFSVFFLLLAAVSNAQQQPCAVADHSGQIRQADCASQEIRTALGTGTLQPAQGYIVELEGKPLAVREKEMKEQAKGTVGISAASMAASLNAHKQQLRQGREQAKSRIASALSPQARVGKASIGAKKLDVLAEYENVFNGLAVDVTAGEAEKIRKLSGVRDVHPNVEVRATLSESVPLIGAPEAWKLDKDGNECAKSGKPCLTGKGVKIAIIDTGVDYTHPDLGACKAVGAGCKVAGGYDFINNDNDPMDDNGHGTHVAATAAGSGALKGVAPDAQIIAYKILNAQGSGDMKDIVSALERAADPDKDGDFSDHADVISLSLGGFGDPDDPASKAVDSATDAGAVVVVAAGNSGPTNQTVASPGTARKAITVGATNGSVIAQFSSRGPVMWKNATGAKRAMVKPDVVAPGVDICAAQWDSAFAGHGKKCTEGHIRISGTSMATPHVSGLAALMRQARPDWSPLEIKLAIRNSAKKLDDYGVNEQGYGFVNAPGAARSKKPPVAAIETNGKIADEDVAIKGTAASENFKSYQVFYTTNEKDLWKLLCSSTKEVHGSVLCSAQLSDGFYYIRLVVEGNGETSEDISMILVKTHEIEYPASLTDAEAEKRETIPGWKRTEIRGAASGKNFQRYSIKICNPKTGECSTEGVELANGGKLPVRGGVLGTFDPSVLSSGFYEIQLDTEYAGTKGGVSPKAIDISLVYVDKELKKGWPVDFSSLTSSQGSQGMGIRIAFAFMRQPTITDVDNDGKNDMIFAYLNNILVLKHDNSTVHGWPRTIETECGYRALMQHGPAADDIDKDGYLEIIAADNCGYLHAFNHDGTYMSGWPKLVSTGVHYVTTPAIEDLDGDGKKEIIAGDWDSQLHVLDERGNYLKNWPRRLDAEPGFTVHTMIFESTSIGDLDGDGKKEIVAVVLGCKEYCTYTEDNRTDRLYILRSDGGEAAKPIVLPGGTQGAPVLVDIDGDGFLDIVTATVSGRIFAFDRSGNLIKNWPVQLKSELLSPVAVGDVDKDKKLEIATTTRTLPDFRYTCLELYQADGSAKKGWPLCFDGLEEKPQPRFQFSGATLFANVEGDKDNEIIAHNSKTLPGIALYEFFAFNPDATPAGSFPKLIDDFILGDTMPVADLDGDGNNELILYTWSGTLYVWDLKSAAGGDEWPVFHHDPQHTGRYGEAKHVPTGFTLRLHNGWNLVSSPTEEQQPTPFLKMQTTCKFASPLWRYSADAGRYEKAQFITNSKDGYWIKALGDCSVSVPGKERSAEDYEAKLAKGWNLIGGAPESIVFDKMEGCGIAAGPYWYSPAAKKWERAEAMEPGKGYVLAAKQACTFKPAEEGPPGLPAD